MGNIVFKRSIEPDIIEIFDFNLMMGADDKTEIRMLLSKDQEFQLDKATYKES